MTGILGVIIIYIYSMIAYYSTVVHSTLKGINDLEWQMCKDAWSCFVFAINSGLRSGGGIGDTIAQPNPNDNS